MEPFWISMVGLLLIEPAALRASVPPPMVVLPLYLLAAESVQVPEFVLMRMVLTRPSALLEMTPLHSPKAAPISLRRRVPAVETQLKPPDMVSLPLSDWKFMSEPPVLPVIWPEMVLEPVTLRTAGRFIVPPCRQSTNIGSATEILPSNSRRPLPVVLPTIW